jgi:hypothetical protein
MGIESPGTPLAYLDTIRAQGKVARDSIDLARIRHDLAVRDLSKFMSGH